MDPSSSQTFNHAPLLENEDFKLGFDSIKGIINSPSEAGLNSILLTNLRVLKLGKSSESIIASVVPLQSISGADVVAISKSNVKLFQSLVLIFIGLSISLFSWVLLDVMALTLIFGGLPTLAGIYLISGWAMPDSENSLTFYTHHQTINLPLSTKESQLAVHQFLLNFYTHYFASGSIVETQAISKDLIPSDYPNSTFGGTSTANPLENAILSNLRRTLPSSSEGTETFEAEENLPTNQ